MADTSPDSLDLGGHPDGVSRTKRLPLWIAAGVLAILGCILVYSVLSSGQQKTTQEKADVEAPAEDNPRPLWTLDNRSAGLVLPETPRPKEETKEEKEAKPLTVVVKEEPRTDPHIENLRRVKSQAYMTALSSPLVARRFSEQPSGSATKVSSVAQEPLSREMMQQPSADYDPTADKDKEAFFVRAQKDDSWRLNQQRTQGMPLELKTGTVIPGVMLTGINSDLPGNMIAQVSQHVYDTATGHNLLIPQGSKLYGVYDSRVVYGQERVLIAWNRLIFPDGSSIALGAMPGADMGGMAGYQDGVDNHYMRIFGSAILMSLVAGGTGYALDRTSNDTSSSGDSGTSFKDEMAAAMVAQLGQTTTTLLQRNLNIKPTLEVRAGYQFNIVVTKDIVFEQPYTRWRH